MPAETIEYREGEVTFEAHAEWRGSARPAVVIAHTWGGQGELERRWANTLAELGYVGIALDVYGKGVRGSGPEENERLMSPLMNDRELLGRRLAAGVAAARTHHAVDPTRVAAIGFCFGGLCVLDLARRGEDLRGVVSFHGLLDPIGTKPGPMRAKVLVLHGFDDPMGPPESLLAFAREMTEAGADWQAHVYGGTMHAFTNPIANDPSRGTVYNEVAARRSRQAMEAFLAEILV